MMKKLFIIQKEKFMAQLFELAGFISGVIAMIIATIVFFADRLINPLQALVLSQIVAGGLLAMAVCLFLSALAEKKVEHVLSKIKE